MNFHRCKDQGFSLVEVLISMAIIAAVVILAFSAVKAARVKMAETKSTGNLRQMAPALLAYTTDHGGRLPEGAFGPSVHGKQVKFWFFALDAYISGKVPDAADQTRHPAWLNDPLKVFPGPLIYSNSDISVGFGWNHSYFGYTASWYPEKLGWGSRLSEVSDPARTIIIGTSEDNPNHSDPARHVLVYPSATAATKRYRGGGLYLFLDGHVERLTPEAATGNNQALFRKVKLP